MSEQNDNVPGWIGTARNDGVHLRMSSKNSWSIVRPHDGTLQVTSACPCCGAAFRTSRSAKLVGNSLYPPPPAPKQLDLLPADKPDEPPV